MGHSKRLWDKLLGEISRYKPEGITTNTPRKECQARSKGDFAVASVIATTKTFVLADRSVLLTGSE